MMKMKTHRNARRWAFGLLAAVACMDGTTEPGTPETVATVEIVPRAATLGRGETLTMTAVARDVFHTPLPERAIIWTTSNAAIASVDVTGRVDAQAWGTARVRAAVGGRFAEAVIGVLPKTTAELRGAWEMTFFDGVRVPGTYAVYLDIPVDEVVIGRVEIRLDSATMRQDGNRYTRSYCFSELHNGVFALRYCWGDRGWLSLGANGDLGRVTLVSDYIQNLSSHGYARADGTQHLVESLYHGEFPVPTIWERQ